MTYRSPPEHATSEVTARVLFRARYVAPLVVVAICASVLAFASIAPARASLVIEPDDSQGTHVASYAWHAGIFGFGDGWSGDLDAWYAHARVTGVHVGLANPLRQSMRVGDAIVRTFIDVPTSHKSSRSAATPCRPRRTTPKSPARSKRGCRARTIVRCTSRGG